MALSKTKNGRGKYCSPACYKVSKIGSTIEKDLGAGLKDDMAERPKHFHHSAFGCELEQKSQVNKTSNNSTGIAGSYCLTHKVATCRCGWEWGHHSDTYSSPVNIYSDTRIDYSGGIF